MAGDPLLDINESLIPSGGLLTGVTTVGTVATQISALSSNRRRVVLQNTSAATVTIGGSSNLAVGVGYVLSPGASLPLPIGAQVVIYGVAPSNGNQVSSTELVV